MTPLQGPNIKGRTMTPLPREARQILAKLELVSHGAITAYNSSGGKDSEHPGGKKPSGDSFPPHIEFRIRMEHAPWHIPALIVEATKRWENLTGRTETKKKPTAGKTDAELIIEDGVGFTPNEVAAKFRCSATMVRKLRLSEGLDTETGKKTRIVEEPNRLEEAIRLRKLGWSFGMIEARTGIRKSSLHDAMKRAA